MSKYELTISPSYAMEWTLNDALRELFQNAIDQEKINTSNAMFHSYSNDVLTIGNKESILAINSLLLGETTKLNNSDTIGQFGEGYKIATLVLLRLGKQIIFYNYGAKEVWRPRFVDSRRYNAKVLTFFVDKKYVWQAVPDNNLTIEVSGITQDEYVALCETILMLQEPYNTIETNRGNILLDKQHATKIFVNGLYISSNEDYKYGYDFKPAYISIGRDRRLISDFDTKWLSSTMWNIAEGHNDTLLQLIAENASDVEYVESTSFTITTDKLTELRDRAYFAFIAKHGRNAVPISSQDDLEKVPKDRKAIVVPSTYRNLVISSSSYDKPDEQVTTADKIQMLKELSQVFNNLSACWSFDELDAAKYYPFAKSFDELAEDVDMWANEVITEINK